MTPTIRHQHEPPALGCRWCGVDQREHVQLWVPSQGWHGWVAPTRAQVEARMWARIGRVRAERSAARAAELAAR